MWSGPHFIDWNDCPKTATSYSSVIFNPAARSFINCCCVMPALRSFSDDAMSALRCELEWSMSKVSSLKSLRRRITEPCPDSPQPWTENSLHSMEAASSPDPAEPRRLGRVFLSLSLGSSCEDSPEGWSSGLSSSPKALPCKLGRRKPEELVVLSLCFLAR